MLNNAKIRFIVALLGLLPGAERLEGQTPASPVRLPPPPQSFTPGCTAGFTVESTKLTVTLAQASSCEQAKAAAADNLAASELRSACQSNFGGPLPNSVLSFQSLSCAQLPRDGGFEVVGSACCPNPCLNLDMNSCTTYNQCSWGKCDHRTGKLGCDDLTNRAQCENYPSSCRWKPLCSKARDLPNLISPFACRHLDLGDCSKHPECEIVGCSRKSGSLECNDLDQDQCARYGNKCEWRRKSCRKKIFSGPFECNDLTPDDCQREGECTNAQQLCRHKSGNFGCNNISEMAECDRYNENGCRWEACVQRFLSTHLSCELLNQADCNVEPECQYLNRCFHQNE